LKRKRGGLALRLMALDYNDICEKFVNRFSKPLKIIEPGRFPPGPGSNYKLNDDL
jgi:hypothetical protein